MEEEWRRDGGIKNAKVWGQKGLGPDLVALTLNMFLNLPNVVIYRLRATVSSGACV